MARNVLTGGPGNGKTTTCFELFKLGYLIGPESARPIIKEQEQLENGILPWTNLAAFQLYVLDRQLQTENRIHGEVYLDRGIIDNIAYCRDGNIPVPNRLEHAAKERRYDNIFILEPLPFYETDAERKEPVEQAKRLHQEIWQTYRDYGYDPIHIPATYAGKTLTPAERAEYILEVTNEKLSVAR